MQPIKEIPLDVVQITNSWAADFWIRRVESLLAGVPEVFDRRDLFDFFNERAAICEFDGGLTRFLAEQAAFELLVECIEANRESNSGEKAA